MAQAQAWPYRFELIALDELFVDPAYQRPLSNFLERIKANYDPALIGTLAASERKKGYALIDGQTRAEGMRFHEEPLAPCVVYEGLTRKEEARLFAKFQTERRGMATWLRFRAALISGDDEAGAIAALVRASGFKMAGDEDQFGIRSIAAIEFLYRRDPELLQRVLEIVGNAWPDPDATTRQTDRRTRSEILRGIGRFIVEEQGIDDRRLTQRLRQVTPDQLRHRANALREGSGSSGNYDQFIAQALVGVYATRSRIAA